MGYKSAGIDCAPSSDQTKYFAAAVIWDLKTRQLIEYHLADKLVAEKQMKSVFIAEDLFSR